MRHMEEPLPGKHLENRTIEINLLWLSSYTYLNYNQDLILRSESTDISGLRTKMGSSQK